VVVEDRPELFRDRLADLGDVVEARQRGGHAVQHVQLRDEAEVRRWGGFLSDVVASRHHGSEPS